MIKKLSIIGGDLRLVKLAEMFIDEGAEVYTYGLENADFNNNLVKECKNIEETINYSDIIVGPIPFTSDGKKINTPFSNTKIEIEELFKLLKGKVLIAGAIRTETINLAEEYHVKIIDIMKREELSVLNAISTAEGAIKIAIEETLRNLHGSNVLVMGFGRIGKVLSQMLNGIGAKVDCEARKDSDLAWIKAYGYTPVPLAELKEKLEKYDVIINTIPYMVLDREAIDLIKKDALVIDLASNPGGVDKIAIKEKGIKFVWALSLPAKVAPITSAEFIKETLYNVVKELEN